MKTILVTGCAGFIGGNFVRQFKNSYPETEIVGIDDFSTGRRDALDPSVTFYEGSVSDATLLEKVFSKHHPEYVFHFAAIPTVSYSVEHPRETNEVNMTGTVALLEASKKYGVKRFILSSSSAIYGSAEHLPTVETDSPDPKSPYAIQKYAGELFCKMFSELFGLDTVSLRYFNVYGPGEYGGTPHARIVAAWLEPLYFPTKTRPFIEGDGEQSRDFCYVDDVVRANMLAMESEKPLKGEAVNIASGKPLSINEMRQQVEKCSGKNVDLEKRPARTGDVRHTCADITKAKMLLGYEPQVSFDEGLEKTVKWFISREK